MENRLLIRAGITSFGPMLLQRQTQILARCVEEEKEGKDIPFNIRTTKTCPEIYPTAIRAFLYTMTLTVTMTMMMMPTILAATKMRKSMVICSDSHINMARVASVKELEVMHALARIAIARREHRRSTVPYRILRV